MRFFRQIKIKFSESENNARSDHFCFKKLSGGGSTTSGNGCSGTARSTISTPSRSGSSLAISSTLTM